MKVGDLNFFAELLTTEGYNKYYQRFEWAVESECENLGIHIVEQNQPKEFILVLSTIDDNDGNIMPIHVHYYFKDFIANQSKIIENKLLATFEVELIALPNDQIAFQVPFLMGYTAHLIFHSEQSILSYNRFLLQSLIRLYERLQEIQLDYLPKLVPSPETLENFVDRNKELDQLNKVEIPKALSYIKGQVRESTYEDFIEKLYITLRSQALIEFKTSKPNFRHLFVGPVKEKIVWLGKNSQLKYLIRGLVKRNFIKADSGYEITAACFKRPNQDLLAYNIDHTGLPKLKDQKDEIDNILKAIEGSILL
ncbi:hypothetical protein [Larkinella rosea]|uniref:Uncharacterized protein n=1 Tax=Larkinella rosea TaxID=2025312 RepID=A0A3P1C0P3_9BACT|nr:hypothetical protein [Larkinella rosea]RRB06832.1 hypothetical protein EHT25_03305 [Larkinella rosea]